MHGAFRAESGARAIGPFPTLGFAGPSPWQPCQEGLRLEDPKLINEVNMIIRDPWGRKENPFSMCVPQLVSLGLLRNSADKPRQPG